MSESFKVANIGIPGSVPRAELRNLLGLTGCEVSVNSLAAGQAVPFVHAHHENEEVYLILSGSGEFWLDGAVHGVTLGDAIRVNPKVERCLRAGATEGISYICIQAKQGSTAKVTREDGYIIERSSVWN